MPIGQQCQLLLPGAVDLINFYISLLPASHPQLLVDFFYSATFLFIFGFLF